MINKRKKMEALDKIFDNFDKRNIFKDKFHLQADYRPDEILHRENQIKQIASILAPVLRGEKPSNLFVYGRTGTGKTLSVNYIKDELLKRNEKNPKFTLRIEYLNCKLKKISDTEYRILAELIKKFDGFVPETGISTNQVYNKFLEIVDEKKQLIILILDEIDQTVKKIQDEFLYNLTRINSELKNSKICFVGISNDVTFLENIDARVKSSLSEEEIIFEPYNAIQLQDILSRRAKFSFKENIVEEGVIAKCAALAAREHGDARKALDLLRIAGELAERSSSDKVKLIHLDQAKEKIEKDKVLEIIGSATHQSKIVLYAIILLSEGKGKGVQKTLSKKDKNTIFTGDVYNLYQKICEEKKLEILTQRRVGDLVQEFDMHGIINVRVISRGRGGRMREIKLSIGGGTENKAKQIIEEALRIT